jgi:uncharacterized protein (DUF2062 family)
MTPPGDWLRLRERLRRELPTAESLARHRWLRPVAHRLFEHGLWHAKTESVARGVAIGMFWAFVVPFAQIVFAAAHCVWWRANIPVAAGITFITNPLTVGGWLWLAYQLGSLFVSPGPAATAGDGWLGQLQALGWPTVVGMGMFAVGGSILGYGGVKLFARARLAWRIRRRTLRRRACRV